MECGMIYIKIIPKSPKAEWLQHCHTFDAIPQVLQLDMMSVIDRINQEYSDKIIVPLFNDVHPGCIVLSEYTEEISKRIFDKFDELMFDLLNEHCIRCAYVIGEVNNYNSDTSIHETYGNSLVRLGRFLDFNNEIGIFKA
jgi:hypothetical protein